MSALLESSGVDLFGLAQALSALALLGALAWLLWRVRAVQFRGRKGRALVIEEKLALDLRNNLLIVRVEQRRLLLAASDHGPARLIAELDAASVDTARLGGPAVPATEHSPLSSRSSHEQPDAETARPKPGAEDA